MTELTAAHCCTTVVVQPAPPPPASGGSELARAEVARQFNTQSTTGEDVPGMTVTFLAGERPLVTRLACDVAAPAGDTRIEARILLDGKLIARPGTPAYHTDRWASLTWEVALPALLPGTEHTVKVALASPDGGGRTVRLTGDATHPASLAVVTR